MSERDEGLLQLALSGELAPDAPELRELFGRRPELRRRLDELAALAERLEASADDEARAIELARAQTTERDRQAVAAALRAGRNAPTSVRIFRRRWWPVAAAALLVATAALAVWITGRGPEPRQFLDRGAALAALEPVGDTADFAVFRWTGRLGAAESFVVRVCERNPDGTRGRVRLESPRCRTNSWTPSDPERAELPDAIVWWVERVDASGTSSDASPEVRARRSR